MRMKYNLILESILDVSNEFKHIIRNIIDDVEINYKTSEIAQYIYEWIIDEDDIETRYNFIKTSDKNDEISFLQDSQYQKFLQDNIDISTKKPNFSKVGRFVRQLLKDNDVEFADKDIEDFVNMFKSKYDYLYKLKKEYTIEIVKGDDIKKWYDCENYYSDDGKNGTLWNSCMRYKRCQSYFDIYVNNPDKVGLIILKKNDTLISRALLWKIDQLTYFIDRIYTYYDSDIYLVEEWATKELLKDKKVLLHSKDDEETGFKIDISVKDIEEFPYIDSIYIMYIRINDDGLLDESDSFLTNSYNNGDHIDGYIRFSLQDTDGSKYYLDDDYYKFSKKFKRYFKASDCKFVKKTFNDDLEDFTYYPNDDVIYSSYISEYIHKNDAIYIDSIDTYYYKTDLVKDGEFGIVPRDSIKTVYYELKDEYIGKSPALIFNMLNGNERNIRRIFKTKRVIKSNDIVYISKYDSYFKLELLEDGDHYSYDIKCIMIRVYEARSFNEVKDKYSDILFRKGTIFQSYYFLKYDVDFLKIDSNYYYNNDIGISVFTYLSEDQNRKTYINNKNARKLLFNSSKERKILLENQIKILNKNKYNIFYNNIISVNYISQLNDNIDEFFNKIKSNKVHSSNIESKFKDIENMNNDIIDKIIKLCIIIESFNAIDIENIYRKYIDDKKSSLLYKGFLYTIDYIHNMRLDINKEFLNKIIKSDNNINIDVGYLEDIYYEFTKKLIPVYKYIDNIIK